MSLFGSELPEWMRKGEDARDARDEAVERVGSSRAGESWMDANVPKLAAWFRANPGREFTTDDLWPICDPSSEPRVMGAAMTGFRAAGTIEPTDRYRQSESATCHARPKRVWRVK